MTRTPDEVAREVVAEWAAGFRYSRLDALRLVITHAIAEDRATRTAIPGAPLSEDRLDGIRERVEAATPGTWYGVHEDDAMFMNFYGVTTDPNADPADPNDAGKFVAGTLVQSEVRIGHDSRRWHADAMFISTAHQDVPALLDHIAFLTGLLDDRLAETPFRELGRCEGLEEAARLIQENGRAALAEGNSPIGVLDALADTIRQRKASP